ncbi:hypothetical protein BJ138DRAFT_906764 [Hygrophoropsis aurantiaca]|uniref:Uncharacterized protein n=1 Tax=Hygrophoropsis aurantiaca TaxID=72124 RepID=A0ACB8AEL9_9AGAM|nr:hypothetical protein BJ138DRAFT_906764 [Hygrophoropsis aurantiaca]
MLSKYTLIPLLAFLSIALNALPSTALCSHGSSKYKFSAEFWSGTHCTGTRAIPVTYSGSKHGLLTPCGSKPNIKWPDSRSREVRSFVFTGSKYYSFGLFKDCNLSSVCECMTFSF